MAQQPLRGRLHDDEVVRREHGPGVVDRLLLAAEPERSHPELLGEALRRLHRARHALDGGPSPLEARGARSGSEIVWSGWSEPSAARDGTSGARASWPSTPER